jgi:cell shape-determining protein MreD
VTTLHSLHFLLFNAIICMVDKVKNLIHNDVAFLGLLISFILLLLCRNDKVYMS